MTNPHSDDRHPFWTVQAVFDPDGTGKDFAYTIGLHERGVPELLLWARPSLGDDPGDDWKLSMNDTGVLLNELSWLWLDGRLAIGDTLERTFDAGMVTVHMRVDPPGDRDLLEAFGIAPGAAVVPLRWSLRRPSPGALSPMGARAQSAAEEEFWTLAKLFSHAPPAPDGWEIPDVPDWSMDGPFGPRTPLVLARAAFLWTCDAEDADGLVDLGMCVESVAPVSWPLATIRTLARANGRQEVLARLERAAVELVTGMGEVLSSDFVRGFPAESRDQARHYAERMVVDLTVTALAAEVVADLLPDDLRLAALGPLAAGRLPAGTPPGADWLASVEVRRVVDDLVRRLGPAGVLEVSSRHASQRGDDYLRVAQSLAGLLATTPTGWLPLPDALDHSFFEQLQDLRGTQQVFLQAWAGMVSALITHRMRFTGAEVDDFVAPYRELLPDLPELLNTPLIPDAD